MKEKEFRRRGNKPGLLLFAAAAAYMIISGCASFGSISLNSAVMKYDDAVLRSEQQSLLLNILRMHDDQSAHFTAASGISATFTLTSTGTLGPLSYVKKYANIMEDTSTGSLSLGGSFTESPMITITPMQGKDFAERLLSPIDTKFVNAVLVQQGRDKLQKMLRLTGADFLIMGPEKSNKIFDIIKNAEKIDNTKKKNISEGINNPQTGNVSKAARDTQTANVDGGIDKSVGGKNEEDNKPYLKVNDFKGLKAEYKYPFNQVKKIMDDVKKIIVDEEKKIIEDKKKAKKNEAIELLTDEEKKIIEDKKEAKKNEAIELLKNEGFLTEEASCLLEDNCFIKNTPPKIISLGSDIEREDGIKREDDILHYKLFRKIVLHIKAVQLSNLLNYTIFDVPIEDIKGTFRKDIDFVKEVFKDTVDLHEKQYRWHEMSKPGSNETPKTESKEVTKTESKEETKLVSKEVATKTESKEVIKSEEKEVTAKTEKNKVTEPVKPEGAYILGKNHPVIALTDFDYASMDDEVKQNLVKIIQDDLAIGEERRFGESVILVLLRGSGDNRWPIYGLFTLRNFRQVMQFLADSLANEPGYAVEYDVEPSKFTTNLLDRFNDKKYEEKLSKGCLDNPKRTLTIYSSRTTEDKNLNNPLVEVDYNGKSYKIATRQNKTQVKGFVDTHPLRWDGQVLSMLYEMFQFNRNTPDVSTPSVTISK